MTGLTLKNVIFLKDLKFIKKKRFNILINWKKNIIIIIKSKLIYKLQALNIAIFLFTVKIAFGFNKEYTLIDNFANKCIKICANFI